MNYDEAKRELKPLLGDYVKRITKSGKSRNNYVCPLCGSGDGKNGTPAFNINPKNTEKWHCFSCGEGGDIFDLIGKYERISDNLEQLKRACEIFGIDLSNDTQTYREPIRETRKENTPMMDEKEEKIDRVAYYTECKKHIGETDYLEKRGISKETANQLCIGYDPNYTEGVREPWKAIIIPTGRYSFVARNTDPKADKENRYRHIGSTNPFNVKILNDRNNIKPIFITEGEIDALSIIEIGYRAIGLGSTSGIDKFVNDYIWAIEKDKPLQSPFIIALDNDEAGKKATEKLAKLLDGANKEYYIINPYGNAKDASEALEQDREGFIKEIAQAELQGYKKKQEYLNNSAGNHLQEFIDGIAKTADTPNSETGFNSLDKILEGGLREGLYILGASTSMGKTTMALQIADQLAQKGYDVLYFTLEMSRTELMSKSISRHTIIDVITNGGDTKNAKTNLGITIASRYEKYSKDEIDLIKRATEAYSEYANHLYFIEGIGDIDAEKIKNTVAKHILFTGRTPIVFVDYIQIMAPYEVRATDKQNMDKNVLELKRLSRDIKTPVIAISSLNRASYRDEITEASFKESGAIEYGSDVLMGLQLKGIGGDGFKADEAKRRTPREMELVIIKNRNGEIGRKIGFDYYSMFNYFKESED